MLVLHHTSLEDRGCLPAGTLFWLELYWISKSLPETKTLCHLFNHISPSKYCSLSSNLLSIYGYTEHVWIKLLKQHILEKIVS
jgi:hypothetical protein